MKINNIWNLQNQILENLKEEVKKLIGERPPLMRSYYKDYKKIFKRFISFSSYEELISDILLSNIVYCGDYHTLKEAQFTNIKLLNKISQKRNKIIIAMEAFLSKHQPHIDQFMQNKYSTKEFLNKINYKKTFGFNWENYEPIIDFAKKNKLKIIGLDTQPINPKSNLASRDKNSARIIAYYSKMLPNFLIWVIIGDLHLAPNHLPKMTEQEFHKKNINRNQLIIYQNSETLYKMLEKKELIDKIEVIKVRKNAYCIMNTPPWLKYQSYIHWIEYGENLPKKINSLKTDDSDSDITDEVASLIVSISNFFNLKSNELLDFTLYTPNDLSFLNLLPRNSKDYNIYKKKMINLQNFVIPDKKILFLSKISIDCMSELASMHIYYTISKTPKSISASLKDLYVRIIINCLATFCSKIINYKRAIPSLQESIHNIYKFNAPDNQRKILSYALLHESITIILKSSKDINSTIINELNKIAKEDYRLYHSISNFYGKSLGDKLYYSYANDNKLLNKIINLFFIKIDNLPIAIDTFFKIRNISFHYEY